MTDHKTVLDEWVVKTMYEEAVMTEKRIQLLLQPKPRWLPAFLWRRILRRLLLITTTIGDFR